MRILICSLLAGLTVGIRAQNSPFIGEWEVCPAYAADSIEIGDSLQLIRYTGDWVCVHRDSLTTVFSPVNALPLFRRYIFQADSTWIGMDYLGGVIGSSLTTYHVDQNHIKIGSFHYVFRSVNADLIILTRVLKSKL